MHTDAFHVTSPVTPPVEPGSAGWHRGKSVQPPSVAQLQLCVRLSALSASPLLETGSLLALLHLLSGLSSSLVSFACCLVGQSPSETLSSRSERASLAVV